MRKVLKMRSVRRVLRVRRVHHRVRGLRSAVDAGGRGVGATEHHCENLTPYSVISNEINTFAVLRLPIMVFLYGSLVFP